jgi:hypothetical protein
MTNIFTALFAATILATTTIPSLANSTGNESNNPYVIQGLGQQRERGSFADLAVVDRRVVPEQENNAFEQPQPKVRMKR